MTGSQIGRQLLSFYSGDGKRIVMVIHAFGDEGGTDEKSPVVCVSVFYADEEGWKKFKSIWEKVEGSRNFHARKSSVLFEPLCKAIEESKINGLLNVIGKKDFEENASAKFKSVMGNCYALGAFICSMFVHKEVNDQPVSVVFESGQPNVDFVLRILQSMIEANEHCLVAASIAKKKEFVELHPADFVAHVAGTYKKEWIIRLMSANRLKFGYVMPGIIHKTSRDVADMINMARRLRDAAKKRAK